MLFEAVNLVLNIDVAVAEFSSFQAIVTPVVMSLHLRALLFQKDTCQMSNLIVMDLKSLGFEGLETFELLLTGFLEHLMHVVRFFRRNLLLSQSVELLND